MKRFLAFELSKLQFKINKMIEFYQMYKTWCIYFDNKVDELYKQKYEK